MSWAVRISGILSRPALFRPAASAVLLSCRLHSVSTVKTPRWYTTKISRPLDSSSRPPLDSSFYSSSLSKSLEDIILSFKDKAQTNESIEKALHSLIELNEKTNRVYSHYLYPELRHLFLSATSQLTPNQAGHMLWLCKYLHYKDSEMIAGLLSLIQKNVVGELTEEQLMSVCWSLAHYSLHNDYRVLLDSVSVEVVSRLVSKPQMMIPHISFICWSYAIINHWPEQLTDPLIFFVESNVKQIPMWDLSIIVWSMAKMGVADKKMFRKVRQDKIGKSREQSLCVMLRKVGQVTADKIGKSSDQTLCMLMWSFGHLSYYDDNLFNQLSEEIVSGRLLNNCSPRTLATFVWACSKVYYYNYELMECFAQRSLEILHRLNPHDISLIAYGFGFLNHSNVELVRALADRLVAVPYRRNPIAVMNTMWGCLVSDIYPRKLIQLAVSEASHLMLSNKHYNFLTQMLQLDLACKVEHPQLNLPSLPSKLLGRILQETIDQYTKYSHSEYDSNVHYALYHLFESGDYFRRGVQSFSGYELDTEILLDEKNEVVAIPESCYRVHSSRVTDILADRFQLNCTRSNHGVNDWLALASDWGVEDKEVMKRVKRRVAIEADGLYHYAVNCHHRLGKTVLKHRQLKALGWDVIPLPYYEWDPLSTIEEQANFLCKRLEQLGSTCSW